MTNLANLAEKQPNLFTDLEIWKDIPEYEGFYQVSNLSRIRSLDRYVWNRLHNGKSLRKGKIMAQSHDSDGYLIICFRKDGKGATLKIHRLVAIAFIQNPSKLKEINHINGIKDDNRIENLEWCDSSHNQKEAYRIGLQISKQGQYVNGAKLTNEQVLEIFTRSKGGELVNTLAKEFNIGKSQIYAIINGKERKSVTGL